MLDFDPNREVVAPRPAATLVLLRDAGADIEVCVMQRSLESKFLGGAVVFPGGRIESEDAHEGWRSLVAVGSQTGRWWDDDGVAARVAACREALEEVGLVPLIGDPGADGIGALRVASASGGPKLREALSTRGLRLDLAALHPLSRWVTPEAEKRRFDARFFVARAPHGQVAESDAREATRVLWATPRALLADFEAGSIALFPPTHRTLELLAAHRSVDEAIAEAVRSSLEPICPRFAVEEGQPVLALPGDPLHEVREARIAGLSRYVLRDAKWVSASPSSHSGR